MNRRLLALLCLGILLSLAPALFADETKDMLIQAFILTREASEPTHQAERADLLKHALEITHTIPDHHMKGHRAAAAEEMRLALDFIHDGKPEPEVKSSIDRALGELRTCAGLTGTSFPGLPPIEHPTDADPAKP